MSIFPDVDGMSIAELRSEHEKVSRRVEARYGRRGIHAPDSNREVLDEDRLDELVAEIERRQSRRRGRAA